MTFDDILYEVEGGVATVTINRPHVHNAIRGRTCEELIAALNAAAWNEEVGVIVLTGAGARAFSSGGDQASRDGEYDGRGTVGLPAEELHAILRDAPKPVIAKVRGWCIGAGNVLATICDLTIASEDAVFGQVGPKVGSVEPGFGSICWPGSSGRSGPRRCGSCAGGILRRRRWRWGSSMRSCLPAISTRRSRAGARRFWR